MTLPPMVCPTLKGGGQNEQWPTGGPVGYMTLGAWGVPNAERRLTQYEVANKWVGWLHNLCRSRGPQRFKASDEIRSGPQVGQWTTYLGGPQCLETRDEMRTSAQVREVATEPLPPRRSPTLHSMGPNQKRPTSGPCGDMAPIVWAVLNACKRGTKSEVAKKGAASLHNPCRLGGPQCFIAGDKISSGAQMDHVDT